MTQMHHLLQTGLHWVILKDFLSYGQTEFVLTGVPGTHLDQKQAASVQLGLEMGKFHIFYSFSIMGEP